jgi:hypothetical protein
VTVPAQHDEMKDGLIKEIKTARMNVRYHEFQQTRGTNLDRFIRFLAALCGSSAVASFAIWKDPRFVWVWQTLAGLSAALSLYGAIASPADAARKHAALRERYVRLRYSLENAARFSQSPSTLQSLYEKLLDERADIEKDEPPPDRKLLVRAQEEIRSEVGDEESLPKRAPKRTAPPPKARVAAKAASEIDGAPHGPSLGADDADEPPASEAGGKHQGTGDG